MDTVASHIFRAYDIRGKAGIELSPEAARLIARAFARALQQRYNKTRLQLCVGRDARIHGPVLEEAVIDGLCSSGCDVLRIGAAPSPVNYFTICTQQLDGGIHITASHNPPEDNGMKLCMRSASPFSGDDIQHLRATLHEKSPAGARGSVRDIDARAAYVNHIAGIFGRVAEGLFVAVDSGSGIAGPTYVDVLERCGATVHGLYIEPDGRFPHHLADPSKYDTLKDLQLVTVQSGAAIGLAFDGDGDRLGIVDETGTIRTADEILLLLSRDHLQRFPGAPVVFTVSNSGTLISEITAWGGIPVISKVGHSFVEHTMHEYGALLGGEQSGHFFCGEAYFPFDDALVAALRILSILNTSGRTFSALCDDFPKVYQAPELRPHCPDDKKATVVMRATEHFSRIYETNTLDGVRIDFGDGAWAGIRYSNTSPCLSICMEARSTEKLSVMEREILDYLHTHPAITW